MARLSDWMEAMAGLASRGSATEYNVIRNHLSISVKWHLILSNGFSRVTDGERDRHADSHTDHAR